MRVAIALMILLRAMPMAAQEDQLPPKVQQEADKIKKWAEDPILVNAVRDQNKAGITMEQILKTDSEWVEGNVAQDFVNGLLTSPCAVQLKKLEEDIAGAMESFVMDAQGALVCATQKTTDYYQGDEPKFSDAVEEGNTGPVTGKRQYDESRKATLLHISMPLIVNSKMVGAISVGISLTKLAEEQ